MKQGKTPRERALARRAWAVRKHRLGHEPRPDVPRGTPEERLDRMWGLTLEAWSLTGRPLPEYSRKKTPVRVRSLDDDEDA